MIFSLLDMFRSSGAGGVEIMMGLIGGLSAVLLSLCVHEWGHAFAAYKSGDLTAKANGRLTLNPLKHLDPIGTLCLIIGGYGWAKPVPVNPFNFEHPKKGLIWTAISGVLTNICMAFISCLLLMITLQIGEPDGGFFQYVWQLFFYFLSFMVSMNAVLFLFNLLPLYPLDGFRLVEAFTRPGNRVTNWLQKYGFMVLIGLIFLGLLGDRFGLPLDLLGYYINFGVKCILWPIVRFWGLIFPDMIKYMTIIFGLWG